MQGYQINLSPFAGEIKQMGNLQFMGLFSKVQFIEEKFSGKIAWRERRIKGLIDHLQAHDKLILPELSRLGRSSLEIMEMLSVLKEKEVDVYDIKNRWELNGSL